MSRSLRIAIVGNGIAGAAASILLRRQGHRIDHFERLGPKTPAGAGMLLHPAAAPLLDELGIRAAVWRLGSPITRLAGATVGGRKILDFRYEDCGGGVHALGIQRQTLLRALSAADPGRDAVLYGCEVESVDATGGGLTTRDGVVHGCYDLIVAADGAGSAIRRFLRGNLLRDRASSSAALVCLVDDPTRLSDDAVRMYFDGPRHVSIWPVGREGANGIPRVNVSINATLAEARAWVEGGQWRREAVRLCPSLETLLQSDPARGDPMVFSYRDIAIRASQVERVVLLGDAAHSMSPQLGLGALLALGDAAWLARGLAHPGVEAPIPRLAAGRHERVRRIQRASRWITPFFQSHSRILATLRDAVSNPVSRLPIVSRRLQLLLASAS